MELYNDRRNMVHNMLQQYDNILEHYERITSCCDKTLMSKNSRNETSIYGMFLPDNEITFCVGEYQGNLITKDTKMDFKYYFDANDRIVLTERYSKHKLLNYIFYFYNENYVDIILYNLQKHQISIIAKIQYHNERIYSFLQTTNIVTEDIWGFTEFTYSFNGDEVELQKETRGILPSGRFFSSSGIDRYKK